MLRGLNSFMKTNLTKLSVNFRCKQKKDDCSLCLQKND
jgi:hypothetical protein